jgi:SAM-dependent methyltransferase
MAGSSTGAGAGERAAQVVARASAAALAWLPLARRIEAMLEPINPILLAAAHLHGGETVVDVGCGTGATAREAARLVAPDGCVLAVDAAHGAIEHARAVPPDPGAAPIHWVVADAERHPFAPAAADVIVSRLGIMFFDDPVAALGNLAAATRRGGRFAAAVWGTRDQSPFQPAVAAAVATATAVGWPIDPGPADTGPFGLGTPRTLELLAAAGWVDPHLRRHAITLRQGGPDATPDTLADEIATRGPVSALLADAPDRVRAAVTDAIRRDLAAHWDGTGVASDATIVVLTARRP